MAKIPSDQICVTTLIFQVSQPLTFNSISIISNMWFADHERARASAISGLMTPFGSMIGLILTAFLARGVGKDDSAEVCMERLQ